MDECQPLPRAAADAVHACAADADADAACRAKLTALPLPGSLSPLHAYITCTPGVRAWQKLLANVMS